MQLFLECLCPCLVNKPTPPLRSVQQPPKKKKRNVKPIQSRMRSKFKLADFIVVSDQDRSEKRVKAYCCPICTLYYTRILACSECVNFVCFSCLASYQKKMHSVKEKLKCPFCASQKSYFCDYELDPHSYFDATSKGFLSKEERQKLDEQGENESDRQKEEGEVKKQGNQQVVQ